MIENFNCLKCIHSERHGNGYFFCLMDEKKLLWHVDEDRHKKCIWGATNNDVVLSATAKCQFCDYYGDYKCERISVVDIPEYGYVSITGCNGPIVSPNYEKKKCLPVTPACKYFKKRISLEADDVVFLFHIEDEQLYLHGDAKCKIKVCVTCKKRAK